MLTRGGSNGKGEKERERGWKDGSSKKEKLVIRLRHQFRRPKTLPMTVKEEDDKKVRVIRR